ncbi:hypothetical protein U1Q18_026701 [Sarracenia purpurea var. burkii]
MLFDKEKPIYEVAYDGVEKKATCSCHIFEADSILCRYILIIFVKKNLVDNFPLQYSLQRRTMYAKDHGGHGILKDVDESTQTSSTLMRNSLMIECLKDVEGQKSQKKHDYFALVLRKVHSELLAMDNVNNEIENEDYLGNGVPLEGGRQV